MDTHIANWREKSERAVDVSYQRHILDSINSKHKMDHNIMAMGWEMIAYKFSICFFALKINEQSFFGSVLKLKDQ